MRDEKEILKILDKWDKNAQEIYKWRKDVFQRVMLMLEDLALHPTGTEGRRETTQLKAASALQSMAVALEELHLKIPVVCPKCDAKFEI